MPETTEQKSKIHFWYIVGILIGLLCLVVTDRWTDKPNFTVFLSNAATLTSLVLGVIAIFYSIVSSVDLAKSLGNIARVSEEIIATRSTMGDFVNQSKQILDTGIRNTEELKTASSAVRVELGALESTLASLRSENQELRDALVPIPGRIDELAARVAEAIPPQVAPTARKDQPPSPTDNTEKFLRRTSLIGLGTILALVRAQQEKSIVDCAAVASILKAEATYVLGFAVALHSSGHIINKPVKDRPRVFEVTKLEPFVENLTIEAVVGEINRRDPPSKALWIEKVKAVYALQTSG